MQRQFRHIYTTRYDESDWYGFLTPSAFLRYMQDVAALDAEDAGLAGNGNWIIKRTILDFREPVQVHTQLEVTTYGIGFTRITAQRGYEARIVGKEQTAPLISARTLWVYLDARGRPTRLPEGTAQIWFPDEPRPQHQEAPWPAFPQSTPDIAEFTVRFSDTDSMRHMNNAAYVEALDDAAWEVYRRAGITPDTAMINVFHYDIEYIESARLGEQLVVESWFDPFPSPGKEFMKQQQIKRGGVTLVRARSQCIWRT
jgi:acyl-CoA thioesterase FadM